MGAGYASGLIAGKALGALAGLNEDAQKKLQQIGVWAGVVKSVAPMLFNGQRANEYNEFYS